MKENQNDTEEGTPLVIYVIIVVCVTVLVGSLAVVVFEQSDRDNDSQMKVLAPQSGEPGNYTRHVELVNMTSGDYVEVFVKEDTGSVRPYSPKLSREGESVNITNLNQGDTVVVILEPSHSKEAYWQSVDENSIYTNKPRVRFKVDAPDVREYPPQ